MGVERPQHSRQQGWGSQGRHSGTTKFVGCMRPAWFISLLRYESHHETLTALKGTVRGSLVHSHCHATNVV